MNKILSTIIGIALAGTVFGQSLKELSLTIATEGPDKYADGTPVLAGETYLLIYVKAEQDFMGVRTDGSLVDPVNNVIVTTGTAVQGAQGSRCGFKAIQYPASLYPQGGTWVLVLLDTRDANGALGGLVVGQSGAVDGVNKSAAGGGMNLNSMVVLAAAGSGLASDVLPPAPPDTPTPVIASVSPNGEAVGLKIKNFSDKANYEVQTRTALGSGSWEPAVGGKNLQAKTLGVTPGPGAELPATVTVPANDTVRFFRVIVPGGK